MAAPAIGIPPALVLPFPATQLQLAESFVILHSVLGGALFHEDISSTSASSMVLVQDVEFASTSEHTLLPFYGHCHLAYAPRSASASLERALHTNSHCIIRNDCITTSQYGDGLSLTL